MQVKTFHLSNLGRFDDLEVALAPTETVHSNITVFIGNNGAGKTSILKALATSLSWFVARVRSEKGSGNPIPEEVILNGFGSAKISIAVEDALSEHSDSDADPEDWLFQWDLAKTRKGNKALFSSSLHDASRLADRYRTALSAQETASLPLIAFYPTERVVLDVPLKIKGRHSFLQIDGYDNSLNQGVDFRRFFEWFREREDTENESGIAPDLFEQLQAMLAGQEDMWMRLSELKASRRDRQLTAVRSAISGFMPGFSNLRVRRKPRLHMSIDKEGETLNVLQLSQGEKSLMALVGDIARRLAMMNPGLENPLEGDGIVLIDEVDMHLHPSWQRSLITRLTNTFPNCQFVLTTHSPLVISDHKSALVYSLDGAEAVEKADLYGEDANSVLLNVMDTDARNEQVSKALGDLLDHIQDGEFDNAHQLLNRLAAELSPNNIELIKARLLLRKQELRRAKD